MEYVFYKNNNKNKPIKVKHTDLINRYIQHLKTQDLEYKDPWMIMIYFLGNIGTYVTGSNDSSDEINIEELDKHFYPLWKKEITRRENAS
jgi:hypothetical protein|tara:strand:+ start:7091 stop:7360 length:270 start_codon:yes stop_codon:yes gene_type:complete